MKPKETLNCKKEHVYYNPVVFFLILRFDLKFDLDTLRFVPHTTF